MRNNSERKSKSVTFILQQIYKVQYRYVNITDTIGFNRVFY